MEENSVSFQKFLILLSLFLFSSNFKSVLFGGEHAQKRVFGVKKELHKALLSVRFLAYFISFYFEILSYLSCGEKIIRLASKNRVQLGEKSTSDF